MVCWRIDAIRYRRILQKHVKDALQNSSFLWMHSFFYIWYCLLKEQWYNKF